jgi:hypothetical protein
VLRTRPLADARTRDRRASSSGTRTDESTCRY